MPRVDRQLALSDAARIVLDRHGVLHIALRQAADRGGAKPDQRVAFVVRISLEIPVQAPCPRGDRQRIVGQREMVDADPLVAPGSDQLRRQLRGAKALLGVGKRALVDHALMPLQPGHVRIAEERDAVRLKPQHLQRASPPEYVVVWCGRP